MRRTRRDQENAPRVDLLSASLAAVLHFLLIEPARLADSALLVLRLLRVDLFRGILDHARLTDRLLRLAALIVRRRKGRLLPRVILLDTGAVFVDPPALRGASVRRELGLRRVGERGWRALERVVFGKLVGKRVDSGRTRERGGSGGGVLSSGEVDEVTRLLAGRRTGEPEAGCEAVLSAWAERKTSTTAKGKRTSRSGRTHRSFEALRVRREADAQVGVVNVFNRPPRLLLRLEGKEANEDTAPWSASSLAPT